jgi:hypothetical protein
VTDFAGYPKTASCACGALTLRATAPPKNVHACCCLNCQRRSGSVYTYTAFFAEADVTVSGEPKTWRGDSDAGRYQDTNFCPVCGVTVFSRLEALPGIVAVPVGTPPIRTSPCRENCTGPYTATVGSPPLAALSSSSGNNSNPTPAAA